MVSGDPSDIQRVPPLIENSQVPLALSTATTAIPSTAPGSGSVTWPAIRSETGVPPLSNASSAMGARSLAPESRGAVFTSLITTILNTASLTPESPSVTVNFADRWVVAGVADTFW